MDKLSSWELLIEGVDFLLLLESEASDQAKKLGLVYAGWGKWKDPNTGQIVAMTKDEKLVKIDPNSPEAQHVGPSTVDGEKALKKVLTHAHDLLGLDPDDEEQNEKLERAMVSYLQTGNLPDDLLWSDLPKQYKNFLNSLKYQHTNSPLVKAIQAIKSGTSVPSDEPSPPTPEPEITAFVDKEHEALFEAAQKQLQPVYDAYIPQDLWGSLDELLFQLTKGNAALLPPIMNWADTHQAIFPDAKTRLSFVTDFRAGVIEAEKQFGKTHILPPTPTPPTIDKSKIKTMYEPTTPEAQPSEFDVDLALDKMGLGDLDPEMPLAKQIRKALERINKKPFINTVYSQINQLKTKGFISPEQGKQLLKYVKKLNLPNKYHGEDEPGEEPIEAPTKAPPKQSVITTVDVKDILKQLVDGGTLVFDHYNSEEKFQIVKAIETALEGDNAAHVFSAVMDLQNADLLNALQGKTLYKMLLDKKGFTKPQAEPQQTSTKQPETHDPYNLTQKNLGPAYDTLADQQKDLVKDTITSFLQKFGDPQLSDNSYMVLGNAIANVLLGSFGIQTAIEIAHKEGIWQTVSSDNKFIAAMHKALEQSGLNQTTEPSDTTNQQDNNDFLSSHANTSANVITKLKANHMFSGLPWFKQEDIAKALAEFFQDNHYYVQGFTDSLGYKILAAQLVDVLEGSYGLDDLVNTLVKDGVINQESGASFIDHLGKAVGYPTGHTSKQTPTQPQHKLTPTGNPILDIPSAKLGPVYNSLPTNQKEKITHILSDFFKVRGDTPENFESGAYYKDGLWNIIGTSLGAILQGKLTPESVVNSLAHNGIISQSEIGTLKDIIEKYGGSEITSPATAITDYPMPEEYFTTSYSGLPSDKKNQVKQALSDILTALKVPKSKDPLALGDPEDWKELSKAVVYVLNGDWTPSEAVSYLHDTNFVTDSDVSSVKDVLQGLITTQQQQQIDQQGSEPESNDWLDNPDDPIPPNAIKAAKTVTYNNINKGNAQKALNGWAYKTWKKAVDSGDMKTAKSFFDIMRALVKFHGAKLPDDVKPTPKPPTTSQPAPPPIAPVISVTNVLNDFYKDMGSYFTAPTKIKLASLAKAYSDYPSDVNFTELADYIEAITPSGGKQGQAISKLAKNLVDGYYTPQIAKAIGELKTPPYLMQYQQDVLAKLTSDAQKNPDKIKDATSYLEDVLGFTESEITKFWKNVHAPMPQPSQSAPVQSIPTSQQPKTPPPVSAPPIPVSSAPTPEPDEEPDLGTEEVPEMQSKMTGEDAESFVGSYLSTIGVDWNAWKPTVKQAVISATKQAFNSQSDVGIILAFAKLENAGVLDQNLIDGLKQDITDKLENEGALDTSPDAFKKHFDYQGTLDSFLKANPAFANLLSQQDKDLLLSAMKTGLNLGPEGNLSGYQNAKQFYQKTLVGKVPGFDETIFKKWRDNLMQYYDSFKNAAETQKQKKIELAQKKKEAEELKKALDAISTGDTAQIINSAYNMLPDKIKQQGEQKIKLGIAKALQAPTSQEMLDALTGNIIGGYSAYHDVSGKAGYDTLKNVVAASWWNMHHKAEPPKTGPNPGESATQRARHVFNFWRANHGLTVGHVPRTNQERKVLVNGVLAALQEPDPNKVDAILAAALINGTSLNDEQIVKLRDAIHQERATPASLNGGSPEAFIGTHAPKTAATTATTPKVATPGMPKDIDNMADFKNKLAYYQVPAHAAQTVKDLIKQAWSKPVAATHQKYTATNLFYQFKNAGVEATLARNLANWVAREAVKNGPLPQQVKKVYAAQQAANNTLASMTSTTDQNVLKAQIQNIQPHQDPQGIVKTEFVAGEEVKISSHVQFSKPEQDHSYAMHAVAGQMDKWRHANIPKALVDTFNTAADNWQGAGQWGKAHDIRKATNEIMARTINGPPPQMNKMDGLFMERTMAVASEDFKEYIKAFQIGQKTYIGPSGFSVKRLSFGSVTLTDPSQNNVKVLLRVLPNKSDQIKGAWLMNRSGHEHFASEQEMVIGASRNLVCKRVIKHIVKHGTGYGVSYEIELQQSDDLNESINPLGFDGSLWKGLSPATIKALIRYNNTPIKLAWASLSK